MQALYEGKVCSFDPRTKTAHLVPTGTDVELEFNLAACRRAWVVDGNPSFGSKRHGRVKKFFPCGTIVLFEMNGGRVVKVAKRNRMEIAAEKVQRVNPRFRLVVSSFTANIISIGV